MFDTKSRVLDRQEYSKPPQYVLVLHLNPDAYDLPLHMCVEHLLLDHLGISAEVADKAIRSAANSGHAVIKPVTKDIGESLLQQANTCRVMQLSRDFKVALEPL